MVNDLSVNLWRGQLIVSDVNSQKLYTVACLDVYSSHASTFYNCIAPVGFLPWEFQVAFPWGKPAATELRHPTYYACWVL